MLFLVFFFSVLLEAFPLTTFSFALSGFQHQLTSFDSTFVKVFGRLLGCGFLKCPQAPLVRQQFSLPISFGGLVSFPLMLLCQQLILGVVSCCPYHCFEILGRFSFVLVGGDKCEQFWFTCIPSPLEVNVGTSSYSGNVVHTFFEQLAKTGVEKGVN